MIDLTDSTFFLKFYSSCFNIRSSFSNSSRISLFILFAYSILSVHLLISINLYSFEDILFTIPVKLFKHFNWLKLLYTVYIYSFVLSSIWVLFCWLAVSVLGSLNKMSTICSSLLNSIYFILSRTLTFSSKFSILNSEINWIYFGASKSFYSCFLVGIVFNGSWLLFLTAAISLSSFYIYSLSSSLMGCCSNNSRESS